MSTLSPQIVLAATSPAAHYNWIKAISDALDALGVVRTADTGQVDLASVTTIALPTNSNEGTYYGTPVYQIRKLASPGKPDIFLRFDFGIMNNDYLAAAPHEQYYYPAMKVSFGSATNGAGVLSSFKPNASVVYFGTDLGGSPGYYSGSSASGSHIPSADPQQCDFASDGQNYLTVMLGENAPVYENYSILTFGVERTIDPATGAYDADGLVGFSGNGGGNAHWFYGDFANNAQWYASTGMPAIAPPFNISNDVSVVNIFPFVGCTFVPKGAPLVALSYYASGISSPVQFPATLYSATHTYKACPRSICSADPYNTGTRLALRFE